MSANYQTSNSELHFKMLRSPSISMPPMFAGTALLSLPVERHTKQEQSTSGINEWRVALLTYVAKLNLLIKIGEEHNCREKREPSSCEFQKTMTESCGEQNSWLDSSLVWSNKVPLVLQIAPRMWQIWWQHPSVQSACCGSSLPLNSTTGMFMARNFSEAV